jgi:hypothetical protein
MYLMDTINQAAERIRAASLVPTTQMMAAYADLGTRLQGTPRFLLDARACQMAVELNMGRPKVLREAMRYARVPYRRMWIEWNDADRQELRDRFSDEMEFAELRPMPGRIGVLLEADEAGRRGTATWVWTSPSSIASGFPNVGCIEPHFDLDQTFPLDAESREGLGKAKLCQFWMDNPIQLEAFFDIWQTCEHKLAAWGPQYLTQFSDPQLAYALSRSDVVGEYIMLWCILLMLTASRAVVRHEAVDMGKVNKHRAKKHEVPLLDHTRVTLNLAPHVERPVMRSSYQHKSPRIHMVSSFLTTRHTREGTRHMIIQPYWRGQGEVIHRQVHVRG